LKGFIKQATALVANLEIKLFIFFYNCEHNCKVIVEIYNIMRGLDLFLKVFNIFGREREERGGNREGEEIERERGCVQKERG
jgi:hypothetical protein